MSYISIIEIICALSIAVLIILDLSNIHCHFLYKMTSPAIILAASISFGLTIYYFTTVEHAYNDIIKIEEIRSKLKGNWIENYDLHKAVYDYNNDILEAKHDIATYGRWSIYYDTKISKCVPLKIPDYK